MKTIKKIYKYIINIAIQGCELYKYIFTARPKMNKDLFKSKDNDIDMMGVMNDINGSRELYKTLSRKYHPDRFMDPAKKEIASELMKDITKYKRNYNKLTQLQKQAENELH